MPFQKQTIHRPPLVQQESDANIYLEYTFIFCQDGFGAACILTKIVLHKLVEQYLAQCVPVVHTYIPMIREADTALVTRPMACSYHMLV